MKKKRKKIKILPIIVILFMGVGIYICLDFIGPVQKKSELVPFKITSGETTKEIIKNLKDEELIKNEYFALLYIKINKIVSLKAGEYDLNKNMSLKKIFNTISDSGNIKTDSYRITFHEGKNIRYYASVIDKKTKYKEEEFMNLMTNKDYIKGLIDKYWFLTDNILKDGIYYPLEGYLAPDTYEFLKEATLEDIVTTMLDQEAKILDKYKSKIDKNRFNIHELMTLASVAELEGTTSNERKNIIGVFINRLDSTMSLGSDVTTYYASKVDMGERDLTMDEIVSNNPYNTRSVENVGKLPIGPICNPSNNAIDATINYQANDYYYFVSDKDGNIYFTKTESEHNKKIKELKDKGKWFEY